MSSPLDSVSQHLALVGWKAKRQWLSAALSGNRTDGIPVPVLAHHCLTAMLQVDLSTCAEPNLPDINPDAIKSKLVGPVLVQLVEVANVGASAADPDAGDSQGPSQRCLKLAVSDGRTLAYGIEHRHMRDLSTKSPAGCKLVLKDVEVRRGYLLLTPDSCRVLGGRVEAMEKVQQAVYGAAGAGAGAVRGPPSQNVSALSPVGIVPSPPARSPPSWGQALGASFGPSGTGAATGRRSIGGTGSAPPLASPVLTQDVVLPPEAAVELIDDDEPLAPPLAQGGGAGAGQQAVAVDLGMDIEDLAQHAGPTLPPDNAEDMLQDEDADITDIPVLLHALTRGDAHGSIIFPPGVCRIAHVCGWSNEPTYSLRMFLCDPVYAAEVDTEEDVEDAESYFDRSKGVWAQADPAFIQASLSGTPAALLTSLLDKRNSAVSAADRAVARHRVQSLGQRFVEYGGQVEAQVRPGQGVLVTGLRDFSPI